MNNIEYDGLERKYVGRLRRIEDVFGEYNLTLDVGKETITLYDVDLSLIRFIRDEEG